MLLRLQMILWTFAQPIHHLLECNSDNFQQEQEKTLVGEAT